MAAITKTKTINQTLYCGKCHKLKHISKMCKAGKRGHIHKCKDCHAKYVQDWLRGAKLRITDAIEGIRKCSKCKENKSISEFFKNGKYYRRECKECNKINFK